MRSVHLSYLNLAARTLMVVPPAQRVAMMATLLVRARTADKYRKKTGRAHVHHGNGSLRAACQNCPKAPMPDRCDPSYLLSLRIVVQALITWGSHQSA